MTYRTTHLTTAKQVQRGDRLQVGSASWEVKTSGPTPLKQWRITGTERGGWELFLSPDTPLNVLRSDHEVGVARALQAFDYKGDPTPWEEIGPRLRATYLERARVAIAEMKDGE